MASGFWKGGENVGQIVSPAPAAELLGLDRGGRLGCAGTAVGSNRLGETPKFEAVMMATGGRFLGLLRWTVLVFGLGSSIALAQTEAPLAPTSPIEGVWRAALLSEVTIAVCDVGFCGYLTKIVVPSEGLSAEEAEAALSMSSDQFFDQRNEDPALRNRPMQDLHMLTLRPGAEAHIFDGEIYNPQDGKTYSGYVEMTGPDTMRLNGCVLYNVICKGEDWMRVPQAELDARAAEVPAQ